MDVSAYGQPPPAVYYRGLDGYGVEGTGPKTLDWSEGDQVPPGYHLDTQVRKGLVIGGSVTFGAVYMLSVTAAAFGGARQLLIPVAGPFVAIGESQATDGEAAALVLNGALQVGGLAMLIAGLAAPRKVLIRNDVDQGFVMPTPMSFGASSGGIGLVGTF
jgi:hypothetical protein